MYLSVDLRNDSGNVKVQNKLVSFLYQLLRDELPAADVEKIMTEVDKENNQEIIYSNGYLAEYAMNIANRLVGDSSSDDNYDGKAVKIPSLEADA